MLSDAAEDEAVKASCQHITLRRIHSTILGLFKGRSRAWTATVILSIIGIAMFLVAIATGNFGSIISLLINGIIIYYLYRQHVKTYIGKAVYSPAADAAAA